MLLIGGFYLVPQIKGAGLTLGEVTGATYWVGVVFVPGGKDAAVPVARRQLAELRRRLRG